MRLVLHRGRSGTSGQELVVIHADEIAAGQALEAVARAKWRQGYQVSGCQGMALWGE